jgi:hypothetical protein
MCHVLKTLKYLRGAASNVQFFQRHPQRKGSTSRCNFQSKSVNKTFCIKMKQKPQIQNIPSQVHFILIHRSFEAFYLLHSSHRQNFLAHIPKNISDTADTI